MEGFDRNKEFAKLKRDIVRANKAITRIENKYGENSWGVKHIYDKLDNDVFKGITKGGRIRATKTMSDEQLRGIQKQVDRFLNDYKTSTLTGIRGVIKEVKTSLKATLGDKQHDISDAEINKLYDLVKDRDKREDTERIGASTIWTTITEAKETNIQDEDEYFKLVEKRKNAKLSEEDKDFLEEIYLKYFNKM